MISEREQLRLLKNELKSEKVTQEVRECSTTKTQTRSSNNFA